MPPITSPGIDIFMTLVARDIKLLKETFDEGVIQIAPNISGVEGKALCHLMHNEDIIIKPTEINIQMKSIGS